MNSMPKEDVSVLLDEKRVFKPTEEFVNQTNVKQWMEKVDIACIGPITAKTAQENGLKVSIIPEEYTIESLTSAIIKYYS